MLQVTLRLAVLSLTLLSSGCAVRSISNGGRPWGNGNSTYEGELSDFDVIGSVSEEPVGNADVVLKPHMRVLLVQSGAGFPDERMLSGLASQFEVAAASGIPTPALQAYGMRSAAARGGFDAIIAYWGILESSERATAAAAATWVPVAGLFMLDSSQRMRIRTRIVIVDVHTGRWRTLMPPPIDDERASSMLSREDSDQDQVQLLTEAAIPVAIEAITHEMEPGR